MPFRLSRPLQHVRALVRSPWLLVFGLNLLLFLPSYVCSQPHAELWPFFPKPHKHGHYGFDAYSLYQYALGLVLRRDNLDVFRVAFDFGLLLLSVIWTAKLPRVRGLSRALACVAYVLLLLFLFYDNAIGYFFARRPALGEDWRLALNLLHFLGGVMSVRWLLLGLGGALGLCAVVFGMAIALRNLQREAARWTSRRRAVVTWLFVLPSVVSLGWFGVERDACVVQVVSKRVLYNWRTSRAEAARLAEIRVGPPDRRYDAFSQLRLVQRPAAYLLMIEAYGEVLSTWDMAPAYRELLARAETRLHKAGYAACTAYSAAPVHGGTSWFSISSVHTGMRVDRPEAYDALQLVAARLPTLTGFFKAQGYRTYALQPGNTDHRGLRRFDTFNHDVMVDAPRLGYKGHAYGWGVIPDQYSLGLFRERYLASAPAPHYVFYVAVSTHWDWGEGVPPYVRDWRTLNGGQPEVADYDASWPAFAQARAIGTELRRSYFRSVAYEWRLLLELLEAERSPNVVVMILGDHQPRLDADAPGGVTMRAPVHVLSRDAAFIERFAQVGFQPGLYADPKLRPALKHEGLFSLWVSKLSAAYGAADAPAGQYYPHGIRLSGLNR
jgi:hypothetical protein